MSQALWTRQSDQAPSCQSRLCDPWQDRSDTSALLHQSLVCRHPLDQQNTRLLQLLPGLQVFARNLMGASRLHPAVLLASQLLSCLANSVNTSMLAGPVAEQVLLLENIGTSLHVGPNQLPSLHKLLVQAAATLQMGTPPDLYVRQHPSPNAYTLAISGRKPFVVNS